MTPAEVKMLFTPFIHQMHHSLQLLSPGVHRITQAVIIPRQEDAAQEF